MICDRKKVLKFNIPPEECIKLCSSEDMQTGVKSRLEHKKVQVIAKLSWRNCNLEKLRCPIH